MSQKIIWTKHVLIRLSERGLTRQRVQNTIMQPDTIHEGKGRRVKEYRKKDGRAMITVILKVTDDDSLLIVSAWIDPPLPGTKDAKKKERYRIYQRAGFWRKCWMVILRQIGFISF
jgi:hypothetical protein